MRHIPSEEQQQKAREAFKLFEKLGTYRAVADEMQISITRVNQLIQRYRDIKRMQELRNGTE